MVEWEDERSILMRKKKNAEIIEVLNKMLTGKTITKVTLFSERNILLHLDKGDVLFIDSDADIEFSLSEGPSD